jgi:hypothetical protein
MVLIFLIFSGSICDGSREKRNADKISHCIIAYFSYCLTLQYTIFHVFIQKQKLTITVAFTVATIIKR